MSTEREIKIYINSVRYEVEEALFSDDADRPLLGEVSDEALEPDKVQIKTVGGCDIQGDRVSIYYDETEISGMEGSKTVVSFDMREPFVVTMMRTGAVSSTLVFETGKRHHCLYNTPYMPFEVCVHTLEVKNNLHTSGMLELDYIVEIRGARAERNKFSMCIKEMV